MSTQQKARFATIAALFGILSPVGWLGGFFLGVIYMIVASGDSGTSSGDPAIFGTIVAIFAFFPPLAAILAGRAARRRIQESGGALAGRGEALTGLVLGYGTIVLFVAAVLAIVLLCLINPSGVHEFLRKEVQRPC